MHFESCVMLAAAMRGRNDVAPFSTRVATLEPLAMNVSLYPIDGELPTLVGATDPATVLEILRDALPGKNATPFVPVQCRVDVAHYRASITVFSATRWRACDRTARRLPG